MAIDFEAEGLLKGTRGKARESRLELLESLAADGAELEELKSAVAEDRLALLPAERALSADGERYTAAQVAEKASTTVDFLRRQREAMGMPWPEADEAVFTDDDVDAANRAKQFLDAGLPEEGMLNVARVIGMTMSQLAAANRDLIGGALLRPGDTEAELGLRYAAAAEHLTPLVTPMLEYALKVHQRELIRQAAISQADLAAGQLGRAVEVGVCFCDMVGFTRLGERLTPDELGPLVGRLGELAGRVASGPVRLIKLIGDAAMLVSREPEPLVGAALDLVAAAEEEGEDFPALRGGLALGAALPQGGDWYGRPVNLASRITDVARPGAVLAAPEVRDAVKDGFRWSRAPARRLKNIEGDQALFRVRRLE